MPTPGTDAGAVVLGGDYVGLGVVRSLGPRGIPLCVVDDELSISRFSRYVSRSKRIESISDGERTVERLLALETEWGLEGWVLFPTRDESVATLSRHRAELSKRFRVSSPAWETFRNAWDKLRTYDLARSLDIPIPRTWAPRTVEELDEIDADPPLVIKPAIKPRFLQVTKKKAWRVNTRSELRSLFAEALEIAQGDPVMVQELIPGYGEHQFAYCSLFDGERALASMIAQRVRQHPMDFGRASTYARTVDLPEAQVLSERLLRALKFQGLVELEYKRDPRDGSLKLLDMNVRTWGYHSLGAAAGVDFPYLLYRQQLGLPLEPHAARQGVTWMRLLTDAPTAALEMKARRLRPRPYLRQLRSIDTEAVFARSDPGPGLAELALLPHLAAKRGF